jgi:hypothetical protein
MNSCYFVLFGLAIWLSEERLAAFVGTSLLRSIAHATQSDAELWIRQDMDNDAYRFYSGLICLLMHFRQDHVRLAISCHVCAGSIADLVICGGGGLSLFVLH